MQLRTSAAPLRAGVASVLAVAALLVGGQRAAGSPVPQCRYGEITLNVAPILSAPDPAHPGDTITSSGGSWTSCGVPFSHFYKEWLRDGVVINGPDQVAGAPASFTYTIQPADVGHAIRSAVQPCNVDTGCYGSFIQSSNAVIPTYPPPAPPPPPPAPVVAQGYVRDPGGAPVEGVVVELFRDPAIGSAGSYAALDTATTGTDGFFVLRSQNTAELQGDAAANDGYVNFDIMGSSDEVGYYSGVTRTYDAAAGIWLTPEQAVADPGDRVADAKLDLRPVSGPALRAGGGPAVGSRWCIGGMKTKTLVATERDSTIIGELLVARDAVGEFSFGEDTEHVSNISVGINFGNSWALGGFMHAATGGGSGVSIQNAGDDWAHVIRSDFLYAKYRKQTIDIFGNVCSTWYTIEPKEWIGGIWPGADESQYLHRCLTTYRQWKIRLGPGATWFRESNKLRTWGAAVTVGLGTGGLGLEAWTGASRWVRYDYHFGKLIFDHYLCGNDAYPRRSTRVFAGG
jgi:hypothetical protein